MIEELHALACLYAGYPVELTPDTAKSLIKNGYVIRMKFKYVLTAKANRWIIKTLSELSSST